MLTPLAAVQTCPHCQTALRFKAGYAIDASTMCPECARPLLKHIRPAPLIPKAKPISSAPAATQHGVKKTASLFQSRFTAYVLLGAASTLFLLIGVLKPALDARSQAALQELRRLNQASEAIVTFVPEKSSAMHPADLPPIDGTAFEVEQTPLTSPLPSVSLPQLNALPHPPASEPVAAADPPMPSTTSSLSSPDPQTPPTPPPPSPRQRLQTALSIPLVSYTLTTPTPLRDLLYDFEEMLNCRIRTEQLSEAHQERLGQPLTSLELQDTSIQAALQKLLATAGLEFRLTDDGDLLVWPID